MMDFADDFTYFTFEQVLAEVRSMYGRNKHVREIRLDRIANDNPTIDFYVEKPKKLKLHQLGLPGRFRSLQVRLIPANS